nr:MAG TPA_asm: hypothetical protein [Caudoviricetes sp.]
MKSIVLYTYNDRPSIILYMIHRIGPCPIKNILLGPVLHVILYLVSYTR